MSIGIYPFQRKTIRIWGLIGGLFCSAKSEATDAIIAWKAGSPGNCGSAEPFITLPVFPGMSYSRP